MAGLKVAAVTFLILDLAAAVAGAAPALFREPLFPSASSKAAVLSALQLPKDLELPGTEYVEPKFRTAAIAAAPPPTAFTLSLVNVDYDLMASMPPQLQLTLPGEAAPITIVRRPDVAAPPHVWVGELEAAPGAGSVVTLVLVQASRTVTGNVHYTDNATRTMRSFLITPAKCGSGGDGEDVGTSSAAAEAAAAAASTGAALHVVVRHQGRPNRPEWTPPRKINKAAPAKPQLQPKILKDAKGRPLALPMKARTAPVDGPGKTAIKLTETASTGTANTTAAAAAVGAVADGARRKLLQAQPQVHTLLIVYTDAAAVDANGAQELENQADSAIASMNKAYRDSNVSIETQKVGFRKVLYTEPSPGDKSAENVLNAVTAGDIPNVLAWRDELLADLVTIFNSDNTVCGIGWLPYSEQNKGVNEDSQGFTAIMRGCWYSLTLAHEIGHNLGCHHDYDVEYKDVRGYIPEYAFGYKNCTPDYEYSTIMSYGDCGEYTAPRLYRFSNPSMKTENGSPLGNAKTADCARKLRESAVNVANYRNSTTTKCKATEKQCEANGKVTCLKDASMCCPPPYKDDCPFTQKCDAKTSRCVSVCNVGFKYCASAVSNKCIPADTCCPGNSNDCPSPYSCPGAGQQCVCEGDGCGCPDGTAECGAGCIKEGTCCSKPDSCPAGQACDGDGGSCYDLCDKGYKLCSGFCIFQENCCPSNKHDCPDPFYCPEWTEFLEGGYPKYTYPCSCNYDENNVDACCEAGFKACQGRCIPEAACCVWPETCGYDSYCAESGTECQPWCDEGATYCESYCYTPGVGATQPICCTSNPNWQQQQCKAPFTSCPKSFDSTVGYCSCPAGKKQCGKSCYPKSNCCSAADCKQNQVCNIPKGKEAGTCKTCGTGTKACTSLNSCIASSKPCKK